MVQVFVLHTNPKESAHWLCNKHTVSQGKEAVQILYTILWLWGVVPDGPVDCGDEGLRDVYKHPYHKHPITLWGAACQAHAMWIYEHCREIFANFTMIYKKKHLSEFHADHWMNHVKRHGFPTDMPETIEAQAWLEGLDEATRYIVENRVCGVNPPNGCSFGILAFKNMTGPYRNDCVESYREYYDFKRFVEFKTPMVWGLKEKDNDSKLKKRKLALTN